MSPADESMQVNAINNSLGRSADGSSRSIVPCNFRSAGRMSNESERLLRSIHDSFARNTTNALDLVLGTAMEVKLQSIEQMSVRECIASISPSAYLLPYAIAPLQVKMILEVDHVLLFPIVDLLLGGDGDAPATNRELTEIDEELLRSVTELISNQLERAWKSSGVSLSPNAAIKMGLIGQIFSAEERVLLLRFDIAVASTIGRFRIALPAAFANALVRNSQVKAVRQGDGRLPLSQPLRQRLLDSSLLVSTELANLRIPIGNLLQLQVGSFLDLRAPVKTAVKLSIAQHDLFEVVPVRSGTQKAAQLQQPCKLI